MALSLFYDDGHRGPPYRDERLELPFRPTHAARDLLSTISWPRPGPARRPRKAEPVGSRRVQARRRSARVERKDGHAARPVPTELQERSAVARLPRLAAARVCRLFRRRRTASRDLERLARGYARA